MSIPIFLLKLADQRLEGLLFRVLILVLGILLLSFVQLVKKKLELMVRWLRVLFISFDVLSEMLQPHLWLDLHVALSHLNVRVWLLRKLFLFLFLLLVVIMIRGILFSL